MLLKYEFWRDGHWTLTKKKKKKNDGLWLLWGIFKEYVKQNIIMAVLRIANADLVAICRLIKKNVKEVPKEKADSNFDFSRAA